MIKAILIDEIRQVYEWVLSRKAVKLGNIVCTESVRLDKYVCIVEVYIARNAGQFVPPDPLEHWGISLLFICRMKTMPRKIRLSTKQAFLPLDGVSYKLQVCHRKDTGTTYLPLTFLVFIIKEERELQSPE